MYVWVRIAIPHHSLSFHLTIFPFSLRYRTTIGVLWEYAICCSVRGFDLEFQHIAIPRSSFALQLAIFSSYGATIYV
jgi:hypothetical protein